MRALFLTHNFPRFAGDAIGSFVLRLAVGLKQHGIDVHVVAPMARDLAREESFEGIPVTRFHYATPAFETIAYTGTMGRQVRESFGGKVALFGLLRHGYKCARHVAAGMSADVVHAHWWFPGGLVARWLKARQGIPYVVTSHGSDVRLARGVPGAAMAFRSVARNAAAYSTVSSWLAREAQALDPELRPVVAPMPVVTSLFAPGRSRGPSRILFVGKLTDQKGLHHLLRALPLMTQRATVDVVGAGRVDDARFRALATELGVADRITWHPLLTQAELATLYQAATVHAVPAVDEGLGLTAVESLLCETPVVAFDSGGLPDIVLPDRTGLLVPVGDHAALAAALDRIVGDAGLRDRLGREGRSFAMAHFGEAAAARHYAEMLRAAAR